MPSRHAMAGLFQHGRLCTRTPPAQARMSLEDKPDKCCHRWQTGKPPSSTSGRRAYQHVACEYRLGRAHSAWNLAKTHDVQGHTGCRSEPS